MKKMQFIFWKHLTQRQKQPSLGRMAVTTFTDFCPTSTNGLQNSGSAVLPLCPTRGIEYMKKIVLPFILAVVVLAGGVAQLFCWTSHRTQTYTGQWISRETGGPMCGVYTDFVVITDIYKDCFFARSLRMDNEIYRFREPLPLPLGRRLADSLLYQLQDLGKACRPRPPLRPRPNGIRRVYDSILFDTPRWL